LDLAEQLGGPIVINFWASWCAPCREEAAGLERTWRAYQQAGVLLVGVDIQDADRDARAFIADFDASYPNGPDPDGKITVDYGVVGLPVTFFVGADGTVEGRWVGAIPEARLVAWVQALIARETPSGETEGANPEGFRPLR
jgi:cytochrome c biogenesis protein CcmG/thiol:disulfide interchange protein DsbE